MRNNGYVLFESALSERAKRLFRLEDVGGPSGSGEDLAPPHFNGQLS
ncbi:MAG: hypothetical protein ACYDAG_12120 [Chloroflexota bacterium]